MSNGAARVVADEKCTQRLGPKQGTEEGCNRGVACPEWHTDPWKPCDHLCDEGKQVRKVICFRKVDGKIELLADPMCEAVEKKPEAEKPCNIRPCEGVDWVTSEWSGCDNKCGLASETRRAHCATQKGVVYPDDICSGEEMPHLVRDCQMSKICEHQWFAAQWSDCSAKCGSGVQTRRVFCGTFEEDSVKKVEDDMCDPSKKYDDMKNCTGEEEVCLGEWFSGPWSKCDKECGGGNRGRKVICMKDEELVPSDNCDPNTVSFSSESCNMHPCGEDEIMPVNTTKPVEEPIEKPSEFDSDEVEEITDDEEECEDGEWVYEDFDNLESFAKLKLYVISNKFNIISSVSTDSGLSTTESTWLTDDLMLSDATGSEDDSKLSSSTDLEGSGYSTSPIDETSPSDLTSDIMTDITEPSNTDFSGSGFSESTDLFSTEPSDLTSLMTEISSDSSDPTTAQPVSESDSTADSTDVSTVITESSLSTDTSEDVSDTTVESSSVASEISSSTNEPESTVSSGSTDVPESTAISGSTDVPESTVSSGSTDVPESTSASGSTDVPESTVSSGSTEVTESTAASGSTDVPESTLTSGSTESSDSTSDASAGTSDDSSDVTSEASTESTILSSDLSTLSSEAGTSVSTDSSVTSEEASSTSDSTMTTEPTPTSTEISSPSSESSTITTDDISTSDVTTLSSDVTTDSSDMTTDSSDVTTDSSDRTTDSSDLTPDSSDLTTDSSDLTTDSSDLTKDSSELTTASSDVTESGTVTDVTGGSTDASEEILIGESDFGAEDFGEKSSEPDVTSEEPKSSDIDVTSASESSEVTTTDISEATEVSTTTESASISSDITTESSVSTSDISTEPTLESSTSSDVSESSEASQPSSEVTSSSDVTTASSMTESTEISVSTPAYTGSTESSLPTDTSVTESSLPTDTSVTESSLPTEISVTGSSLSTEIPSTESALPTESTVSGETEVTDATETTEFDIWSTTEPGASTESSVTDQWGTTPYTIESVTMKKVRKCKRKKKPTCKSTPFGCCNDNLTPAQGPFDKGCPAPKTCNESTHGCCDDEVSPAQGPDQQGCPESTCSETLFGCCPDNKTAAEGNDLEGCKKEPPPPECLQSEFGCCDDNSTAATGPDSKGCKDCEKSEFGCCPDSSQPAAGENLAGCDVEVSTESPPEETTEENCANATFGCCPDGVSVAQGEHFQGCDIINEENCTISYYACCPDGVTAALGPDYQGCRMACEDEKHGCCPDRTTPAHGPNQEGCCLTTPHGCCPDNILAARGPNLEGCGCQYSPFGCCPDNTTAARGHEHMGCGCEHTAHGCCADRYTPAAGPDSQGCACHTFQFGCCPDGISVAKGPHKQGCGCRNTEFGCCSDDRTPAQGADFAGCDCASSKFGCCPDGRTDSQGESFEGCQDVPVNQQESCTLDKDRGSCRNYTVKWFYDMEYGGCSRFWYGGCDGNSNRFKSMDDCKNVCVEPQAKDMCYLPKVAGPCEGYYPSWYYDKDRKQCAQFIWGGCLGNNNRFETRELCQSTCVVDQDVDACDQTKEEGPCNGQFRRWYFDKESSTCQQFAYGGCKSNNNNFPTESACKQQCLQPGRKKDLCALPRAQGNCTQKEPRWYFDMSEKRCMPFYYSGCEGNSNKFITQEACEADCPTDVERDTCTLPALAGECHNYTDRWYYDTNEKRCRQFYYGGCGGNGNNFQNEQACQQRCEQQVSTVAPAADPFRTEFCFLESEEGPCKSLQARWFYDSRDGVCKQFRFGGCQGNGNNFETRDECHQRCSHTQDLCSLPMVVGPCSGDYLQWFYDNGTDTCKQFNFGGCQGNDNRFSDQVSCESRCQKQSVTVTQTPFILTTHAPTFVDQPQPSAEVHICYAPVSAGDCSENVPAWYYDAATQKCQAFVYTGCGGNANRFNSEEQCERQCGRFRGQDVCNYPHDTGPCRGYFVKVYYDTSAGRCLEFAYGGCEGNGNRFSSTEECETICVKREETQLAGNDTEVTHSEICRLPVEIGPCDGRYHHVRWYFDEERGTCVSFIYSGCGGNRNNFKNYQSCLEYCHTEVAHITTRSPNEINVDEPIAKDPCEAYRDECSSLLCPYGTEGYVDGEDCNRCRCYDPCRDTQCADDTQCAIDLNPNATQPHQTQFIAICRPVRKKGECPALSSHHGCNHECRSDADCSGELKCCSTGCGTSCVIPAATPPPAELVTTHLPAYTEAPTHLSGAESPAIEDDPETEVVAEEGSFATLRCVVRGNPRPTISWRKGSVLIDGSSPRYRMMLDGSVQIISLYRTDSGIYLCVADNGVGQPAQKEIRLEVTDPTPHPASVIGDEDTKMTVTLGTPYSLHCYAIGWPRPSVTWWRGDSMLPLSSSSYEQRRDYSLLIHSVKLSNLGIYTCQAYNGLGKAASWSVTVQAVGPVYSTNPDDEKYSKFLISAPTVRPEPPKPQYPYRPIRPQAPFRPSPSPAYRPRPSAPRRFVATPQSFIPNPYTEPSPDIVPESIPDTPRVYTVPVKTSITLSRTTFAVGSDVSIPCDVDGHPVPRVQWYKNRVPIEPSEAIQISESHRLTIIRANDTDSGEYVCQAENQFSRSLDTVNIMVEGVYIHPNCTDNPFFANCGLIVKAYYCTHKYYARFCCRSCTQAGQLPSYGPHLGLEARQSSVTSNLLNKK